MKLKQKLLHLAVKTGLALGALALTIEKDAHAKLPDAVKGLYVEKDGKFALDVDGLEDTGGLKSALQSEREANKAFRKLGLTPQQVIELRERAEQFEGLDAEQVKALLKNMDESEEGKLAKAGNWAELRKRWTDKMVTDHGKALKVWEDKYGGALEVIAALQGRAVDNELRAVATKAGVHAAAIEDVLARGRSMFDIDDDGNVVMYTGDGDNPTVKIGKDGKTAYGPGEWLEEMKEQAQHWFTNGNTGGNAPGSRSAAGKQVFKRSQFEAATSDEKAAMAAKVKKGEAVLQD